MKYIMLFFMIASVVCNAQYKSENLRLDDQTAMANKYKYEIFSFTRSGQTKLSVPSIKTWENMSG
jgi:hypothetical protein